MQKTISHSGKNPFPANYHPREGKQLDRSQGTRAFKQIVETVEAGKNHHGKKIYTSRTHHVLA